MDDAREHRDDRAGSRASGRRRRWWALAAAGALALSGCGPEPADAAPAPAQTRTSAEGAVAAPVGAPPALAPRAPAETTPAASATADVPTDVPEAADRLTTDLLTALGAGDSARAWDLLDPRAQETWGGYPAFAESASGFAEGLAAFASAERTWVGLGAADGSGATGVRGVVLLHGPVEREGVAERAAFALVVDDAGRGSRAVLVSPALRERVELEVPSPGQSLTAPAPLTALVPRTAVPRVLLDGRDSAEQVSYSPVDSDRERLATVLRTDEAPGGPGEHTALVITLGQDGLVTAQAAAFTSGG